ncbi:unnamed protein product [Schistosoma curassoni]|nr:unnamed protein product [Schistosoma curassoni]
MPLRLEADWNNIYFNVADFTKRAYGTNFVEVLRVQIHANCRIRQLPAVQIMPPCSSKPEHLDMLSSESSMSVSSYDCF